VRPAEALGASSFFCGLTFFWVRGRVRVRVRVRVRKRD
jgi:hypothetical protein